MSGLATHYLSECSQRERFRQCLRCRQAVPTSHYSSHTKAQHCVEVEEEGEEGGSGKVCPLCYGSVPPGEMVNIVVVIHLVLSQCALWDDCTCVCQ